MLSIGFDPSFIDTLTFAKNQDDELLDQLPVPGHHHRNTEIRRIAGGNGINVAWPLSKLGHDILLVCPTSQIFDNLLEEREMVCNIPIDTSINETIAIIWKEGEIQFNSITASFGKDQWTKEIHNVWVNSLIGVSLNWGLNPLSDEWVACQWLASCGTSYETIKKSDNIVNLAIQTEELTQPFVVESGSFKHHVSTENLLSLMNTISDTNFKELYPIILGNEEERSEFTQFNPPSKIIHTSQEVILYHKGNADTYIVDQIDCNNPNFVGAGDAFLAGIINNLVKFNSFSIPEAIETAQKYICSKF